ncbi:nucleotidyltransferase domain-containing protein [Candidatus Woesearchaeota archaeon]|nr:nucleotidyltransferase domain-containing protein [Candidatus Woesearchaeota archaeon]
MAKKTEKMEKQEKTQTYDKDKKYDKETPKQAAPDPLAQLPPEVQEQLKKIKEKIDGFQKKILEKFDKYIVGVGLLPPPKEPPANLPPEVLAEELKRFKEDKDKVHVLVLIDDSDSQKMSKQELKDKLTTIIVKDAKDTDEKLSVQVVILSEVWQNCYDAKYDILNMIAMCAPVFDRGMLGAIKLAEVHKQMVLKKFEKYIVSYVLAGSMVTGKATSQSDIDVWLVVDDTDVKKMTRAELRDKLRSIILGMGMDAGDITGIRNKINIQPYLLTDFWEGLREANAVYFTLLRDGVPFYDRGIFMPWKQLLKMGRIKPSPEAIDMYLSSGEQALERVKFRLREIGVEDFFWSILTPSQAALMLYGVPPPAPKETPGVLREVFVKKEKLLTDADVDTLQKVIDIRKAIEHGDKKDITGKEIDELYDLSDKYLKRIKKLFTQIEAIKEKDVMVQTYDHIVSVIREILALEGLERISEQDVLKTFDSHLIQTGKLPSRLHRALEKIVAAKKSYDAGKLTKTEIEEVRKDAADVIRSLVEYLQRKRGLELSKARIRVKYGTKFGEVLLLGDKAFITHDVDAEPKAISKAPLKSDGSLGLAENSSYDELEDALAKVQLPLRTFLKAPIFADLKRIFGADVEVLVHG